jgi:hypothetical protein
MSTRAKVQFLAAALAVTASSCTGGINAGKEGGVAFIAFAGMLIVMLVALWIVIGREK